MEKKITTTKFVKAKKLILRGYKLGGETVDYDRLCFRCRLTVGQKLLNVDGYDVVEVVNIVPDTVKITV